MFNKLKQFKDLRDRAKQIQQVLSQETATGTAGWDKVKVQMNGNQQVLSVTIDPTVMDDKTKLEQLLKEAMNKKKKKIQKVMSTKLKDVGGLDLASEFGEALKK